MAELAEIPTVKAVKQANDDLDQARRIVELGLDLYAGDDPLLLAVPRHRRHRRRLRALAHRRPGDEGDGAPVTAPGTSTGRARSTRTLSPLWELDDVAVNPIPIKTALALVGQDVGGFRLPMVPATDDEPERVRDCLARAGLSVAAAAA